MKQSNPRNKFTAHQIVMKKISEYRNYISRVYKIIGVHKMPPEINITCHDYIFIKYPKTINLLHEKTE